MQEGVNLEKSVILFIVEGTSDKVSFQSVLENFFNNNSVKVAVMYGDVTLLKGAQGNTIKSILSDKINEFCHREKIKFYTNKNNPDDKKDIVRIIHLIDTDGAFVPDCNVIEREIKNISYTEDFIYTNNKSNIENRNSQKQNVLTTLMKTKKLNDIPYNVYFFSRNLEHVLYNEIGYLDKAQKQKLSEDFDDKYADDLEGFLDFINDTTFAVKGNYDATWDFIKKNTNSLKRYCNFHLVFN